jgi:hypothetical protein
MRLFIRSLHLIENGELETKEEEEEEEDSMK